MWFSEKTIYRIFPKNNVVSNKTWFKHLLSWILTMAICLGGTVSYLELKVLLYRSTTFKKTNGNVAPNRGGSSLLGFESSPLDVLTGETQTIHLVFNPRVSKLYNINNSGYLILWEHSYVPGTDKNLPILLHRHHHHQYHLVYLATENSTHCSWI